LYGVARLLVGGTEQARDAVQETLVEAWRGLPGLRDATRYDAWVHRLLVRSCYRMRGQREATDASYGLEAKPDPALDSVVDREQLERGFRRLPAEQRAVLVLRFYLDLSLVDIAMSLGLPEGTVKSRLHRGLASLRAALEADARSPYRVPEGSIQ
jgi:RNA polymerase sigma-70 factor (ECF subfamily)